MWAQKPLEVREYATCEPQTSETERSTKQLLEVKQVTSKPRLNVRAAGQNKMLTRPSTTARGDILEHLVSQSQVTFLSLLFDAILYII